jgi:CheY-like chemotaxis protein
MKRRILLVDDDLAVLLTLKAVFELDGFEVETAGSSAEAFARMESSVYQMVISDLRMETENAGLQVIRAARRQAYRPATALLTAYPPDTEERNQEITAGEQPQGENREGEDWTGKDAQSLLIKPLSTRELLRQVEALLASNAARQLQLGKTGSESEAQEGHRPAR